MFDPSKSLKKMLGKGLQVPRMMTGTKSPSDWDGDGILNKMDCQPRNLVRQDNTGKIKYWGELARNEGKLEKYSKERPSVYASNPREAAEKLIKIPVKYEKNMNINWNRLIVADLKRGEAYADYSGTVSFFEIDFANKRVLRLIENHDM